MAGEFWRMPDRHCRLVQPHPIARPLASNPGAHTLTGIYRYPRVMGSIPGCGRVLGCASLLGTLPVIGKIEITGLPLMLSALDGIGSLKKYPLTLRQHKITLISINNRYAWPNSNPIPGHNCILILFIWTIVHELTTIMAILRNSVIRRICESAKSNTR